MSLSVLDFHREMDRQLFGSMTAPWMKMELKERPKCYELTVEAPGVNKDEIKISFDNGVLMMSAEHKDEKIQKDERVHFSELNYGKLSRQIRFPQNVDPNNITARYDNGLVKIEVPKSDMKKANLIRIQ